jgi:two-component system cell cycle response regulator
LTLQRSGVEHGSPRCLRRAATDPSGATMPASMPPSRRSGVGGPPTVATELDALATPFDLRGGVDLLLDDIVAPSRATVALAAKRSAHRAAQATRRGGGRRAVLVVDSSAIARKFLMQRLEGLGYQVHGAESAEQALAMIERQAFAIVFLEFVLGPKDTLDGLGLCQAIKQKADHPRGLVPAVMIVTGRVGSSDRVRGSLAGCDAYLTKPLAEASFIAALADIDPLFD